MKVPRLDMNANIFLGWIARKSAENSTEQSKMTKKIQASKSHLVRSGQIFQFDFRDIHLKEIDSGGVTAFLVIPRPKRTR